MLEAGHDQSGYPTLSIPQLMFKIFGTDAVKPYIGKAKYGRTIPILQGNVLGKTKLQLQNNRPNRK